MKNQEKIELKNIFNELRNGNKNVIEELYQKYNKMIYGIAFSILKNKEDSEDIVQTVFSKLYTIEQNKMPKDKEATWLYSTTKNEAITFLRKRNNNIDLDSIYEIKDEDINGSLREDVDTEKKEEVNTESNEILKEDQNVQENIIIDTQLISNNTNYVGLSFMGIALFFLTITIIFLSFFIKYQLNGRKKSSK